MFFLKVRDENSNLNGIEMHTLKNKLGTRQLPTAELLLDGTKAFKVTKKKHEMKYVNINVTLKNKF